MEKLLNGFYKFCEKFIKSEKFMNIIKRIFSKEMILYIVFGVLTTVVNLAVFKIFNGLDVDVLISNIIAWIAAVIFAYITNKLFVFESRSWAGKVIAKEIPEFIGARVFSLAVEEAGLLIMIKWLHLNVPLTFSFISGEMVIKLILAIIVVILNYVFSKLVIFKKK